MAFLDLLFGSRNLPPLNQVPVINTPQNYQYTNYLDPSPTYSPSATLRPQPTQGSVAGAMDVANETNTPPPNTDGGGNGSGGGTGGGNPSNVNSQGVDPTSTFEEQIRLAREAAQSGRRQADEQFGIARGIYDEGVGSIGKRRGQFKEDYGQARSDILSSSEKGRGELQRASQESGSRLRTGLRALGLGGSALLKGEGRQRQAEARSLGDLNVQRQSNERQAEGNLNKNLEFLSGQESALNRFLQEAQNRRQAAQDQIGFAERGDVNAINQNVANIINEIISNQQALQAAGLNVQNYQANPYNVDINATLSGLNDLIPNSAGVNGQNAATNVAEDPNILASLDPRRRSGVFGSGLYAA